MKVVAIVQGRMRSTRLPGKVLKKINDMTMIEIVLKRLALAKNNDQLAVATSIDECDQLLADSVNRLGYKCFRGSEANVLNRYLGAANCTKAKIIVRITGDCPIVDPTLVDEYVEQFKSLDVDYLSNVSTPTYPDGLDIEVFKFEALERAAKETHDLYDLEHVTPYLRRPDLFKTAEIYCDENLSNLRWTVDEESDLEVIRVIFQHFSPSIDFSWRDVLDLQRKHPNLFLKNQNIERNKGAIMGKGQKMWKRAVSIIPGGNMLLSKRPEMFLPDNWPAYFSKAKGCSIWDLDNKKYIDMSIMGVGTNILGDGHPEVDLAVRNAIDMGNMSTLNCQEEVLLAEKLIEIHPWADMVRFARTGGEANAISIRIARAASGKDQVAVCGYHGWHDWYLSANLGDDQNLDGHLLPGLNPKGVPIALKNNVFPFNYNDFDALEQLVKNHNIGVIKMEVVRNSEPENNFLQRVRNLATEKDIVLIFDECTSGFRQSYGGLHKLYDVEPDMAIFGKALGNGYAITAIIGRKDIMEVAQDTFISSTFWTERIGPSAALKTLEVMESINSWDVITKTGRAIRDRWKKLANKYDLSIELFGIPALSGYTFKCANSLAYKTFITQEMLSHGFLASNCVYVSTEHTPEIVESYFNLLEPIFSKIKECEDGRDIMELLKGPVCHSGFKRLN
jgi:glutamate-1-semialdehyde 2,1-aminomutase